MICEKCGSNLIVKNNPNYKSSNYVHETHLIYECEECDKITNILFSEFIKENKPKIDRITPKNPSIKPDDEWRNNEYMEGEYI